ncbi:MAG: hypothetical protein Q7R67_00740 [bacterium]|nr:hypothetical protein [bacterium]
MKSQDLKQFNLPDGPGVYYFIRSTSPGLRPPSPGSRRGVGGEVLYIGKATSLKDRVKSYMSKTVFDTRGPRIVKMLEEANIITFTQTDSVLEALILEANQIKKHQPSANSRDKDDKSYNYVLITKEDFPKILIERGRNLESKLEARSLKLKAVFGPFPHAGELREALKIIRKIFPYRDAKCKLTGRPCFNAQIGLCPGPCAGWISKTEYRKQIRNIKLFFEGKKDTLIKSLEKEMKRLAKEYKFEEADKVKRQLFALDHIQDIALIKHDLEARSQKLEAVFRIEAYDIAHISGTNVVGVMTVVEDGEVNKSQYRKFKIRADKNDDVKNLREVLTRRLNHPEWPMPQLIVVDGGQAQLNTAQEITKIPVVAVTKDARHKAKKIIPKSRILNPESKRAVLLANFEAHRFAVNFHRKLRNKGFRI